jgi:hypothetical protein
MSEEKKEPTVPPTGKEATKPNTTTPPKPKAEPTPKQEKIEGIGKPSSLSPHSKPPEKPAKRPYRRKPKKKDWSLFEELGLE